MVNDATRHRFESICITSTYYWLLLPRLHCNSSYGHFWFGHGYQINVMCWSNIISASCKLIIPMWDYGYPNAIWMILKLCLRNNLNHAQIVSIYGSKSCVHIISFGYMHMTSNSFIHHQCYCLTYLKLCIIIPQCICCWFVGKRSVRVEMSSWKFDNFVSLAG